MQEIVDIFKGLLTPIIGVIMVYIAYQQYKTNRLTERRESRKASLDVYKKIKRFLNDVDCGGTVSDDAYEIFGDAIAEADFLFPEEITDWLGELYSWATEWRSQQEGIMEHMKESGLTSTQFWAMMHEDTSTWAKTEQYMQRCIEKLQNAHCDLKQRFSKHLELK